LLTAVESQDVQQRPAEPVVPTVAPAIAAAAGRRGAIVRRALVVADVLGLLAAALVVEALYAGSTPGNRVGTGAELALFAATIPAWLIGAKLFMLYDHDDERTDHSTVDDLIGVFLLVTVGVWMLSVTAALTRDVAPGATKLVVFWALAIALVTVARSAARLYARRRPEYLQNVVVVGGGEVGQIVARKLLQHDEYGLRMVGFVDERPRRMRPALVGMPVLGSVADLPQIIRRHEVARVVLAFSEDPPEVMLPAIGSLMAAGIQVDIVPRFFEALGPHVKLHSVEGLPLVSLPRTKRFPLSRQIKRGTDIVLASLCLIVVAPAFPYIAWRIRRESPGPVLFRQRRLGRGMREFTLYKFRTMRVDTDPRAHREFIAASMDASAAPTANGLYKLSQDDAVTRFGSRLRDLSLDELPQLLNVLKGDMSMVGPRPCLAYETEQFLPHHFERFAVPAGITGLWQVTARAHATFLEALELDVAYARRWSLALDAWLLCRTPLHMVRRKGTV
jgi:exopolysaccharide biosynthesis polyprenyl glycosylphosphotransferase